MFKVVRYKTAQSGTVSTSISPFERVTFDNGSPEEDVRGGFATEEEARSFMAALYQNNPFSDWKYKVVPE